MNTKKISLASATLMNINLMVGASAYFCPGFMAELAGNASFYGWIFAGALFFPIVWCIAQVATRFPGKGSFYSYSKNGISIDAGFLSGWLYFLGYVSIGSLQVISLTTLITQQYPTSWIAQHTSTAGLILIALLALLTQLPVATISRIQSSITLIKLSPLILGVAALAAYWSPSETPSILAQSPLILLPTIPLAVFGFWGFEGACNISYLIENAEKNASRAIFLGFFLTIAIYTLFHLSVLSIMSAPTLAQNGAAGFAHYMHFGIPFVQQALAWFVPIAIFIALINAIFGGIIANSNMLSTMADEKLLFASTFFASRNCHGQPLGAMVAHAAGMVISVLWIAHVPVLNAMSNLGILIPLGLTIISLFGLSTHSRFTQALCLVGLGSCVLLSYYSWMAMGEYFDQRLLALSPLVVITLAGFAMYKSNRCAIR